VYWLPWGQALGARILDPSLKHTTVYGPQWERAMALFQRLRFDKHPVSPATAEIGPLGQNVGFLTGRVAMFNSGPWEMAFCNAAGADYDLLHTPRSPDRAWYQPRGFRSTRITSDAALVYSRSKRKDDAFKLVKFLASEEAQRRICGVQRCPSRRSAAETFDRQNPSLHADKFVKAMGSYPGYKGYAEMQPITEHWVKMERVLKQSWDALVRETPAKRLTPQEAIGKFYVGTAGGDAESQDLMGVLPPADPAAVDRYQRAFLDNLVKGKK
jgi:ABC-type glycerol-3-phosphate transport system substrate-binding protein